MINPFWRFGRTVRVILPLTLDYFTVLDQDNSKEPSCNRSDKYACFRNPKIKLTNRVKQVLEICNAPWAIIYPGSTKKYKFKVYYSDWRTFSNTSMEQHTIDVSLKVLQDVEPCIIVRAKDLITVDRAVDDLKIKIEAEHAKQACDSR